MKNQKTYPALIFFLMVLFASCSSNNSLCASYACATIKKEHIETDTNQTDNLEPIESKGLEEKPKNFQWEDNFFGPNGGKLY